MAVFIKKQLDFINQILQLFAYVPPTPKTPVNKRNFVPVE